MDNEPGLENAPECDPFTPELVIGAMSLIATAVGSYASWRQMGHSREHDHLLTKLIDLVLEIHTSVDDIALLIGQAAPELGDLVPSFGKGGFRLTPLTFVRYARVETKITELLVEIRTLSVELRRAALQADTEREYDLLEDRCVREIDALFARLGELTTGEFVREARAVLTDLQRNLWELRGNHHR